VISAITGAVVSGVVVEEPLFFTIGDDSETKKLI